MSTSALPSSPQIPSRLASSCQVAAHGGWRMRLLPGGDAMVSERDFGGVPVVESRLHGVLGQRSQGSGSRPYLGIGYIMDGLIGGPRKSPGNREQTCYRKNDIVVWHSNRSQAFHASEELHQSLLILPVDTLKDAWGFSETLSGVHIAGDSWLGPMVSGFLGSLFGQIDRIPRTQHEEALQTTVNLLVRALNCAREHKNMTRIDECFHNVVRHIEHHLFDGSLNPSSIAKAHRISLRHLHGIFAGKGLKVASFIRERRLRRAMEVIQRGEAASITELAFQLGFQDSSHFSRLFRQRFDMSPTAARRAAMV